MKNEQYGTTKRIEERYRRARDLMQGIFTKNIVNNDTIFPVWIGDTDCFWYKRNCRNGQELSTASKEKPSTACKEEYRLVNAKTGTNEPAFDHHALAVALGEASHQTVNADYLPITVLELALNPTTVSFSALDKRWRFDTTSGSCTEIGKPSNIEVVSPNGRYSVFARNHNIWLRDIKTGEEKALTTDGEEYYAYGAVSTGWGFPNETELLQVRWSPDSSRLFVAQRDTRRVMALPVVHHVPQDGSTRPTVEYVRVAYPGDEGIEEVRLLSIEVATGRHQSACYGQIPTTRNGYGFFTSSMGWWGKDNRLAYFVDVDRYYKYAKLVEFDTVTGSCRVLFEETSDTHINLMLNQDAYPSYMPLPETDEILWFSERTGWAHLYLYDLKTGQLKNPVTSGPGLVRNIVKYIPEKREVFVQMAAREEHRDPYYRDLVRINIDTGERVTLVSSNHEYIVTPEPKDHYKSIAIATIDCPVSSCGVSKTGNFAVIIRTRADQVPVSYLIDRDGVEKMDLETGEISWLPEGWQWPEPVKLKAADEKTDIYGLVFRPSNFDPEKTYPIISHGFNQPEIAWVPKGSFGTGVAVGLPYMDAAALAELGFIVVQIDGRGSPEREKDFFDQSYGWFESASNIDDHVAGIKQLAERFPYMDLNRVGITAHPTGGSGAVQGLLRHPNFFKVGVQHMYHDRRFMPAQMQGDKYEGPSVLKETRQYPENYIDKLAGNLLLMIGMLDTCTPPAATLRLVEALQKANKDFDLIVLPNLGHASSGYFTRRAWDYLVAHLQGVEPPKEFKLRIQGFGE